MCAICPTHLIILIHLVGSTNYKAPHYAVFSKLSYFLPHSSSILLGTLFSHTLSLCSSITVFHTHAKQEKCATSCVVVAHTVSIVTTCVAHSVFSDAMYGT
jgi:hypothetical protein